MNAEVSKIANEIGIIDENGKVDRDRLLECLVSAFEAGRRSVVTTPPDTDDVARMKKLAGIAS